MGKKQSAKLGKGDVLPTVKDRVVAKRFLVPLSQDQSKAEEDKLLHNARTQHTQRTNARKAKHVKPSQHRKQSKTLNFYPHAKARGSIFWPIEITH